MKVHTVAMGVSLILMMVPLTDAGTVSTHSSCILPCLDLPIDCSYLPMPVVFGVSQTNRCELYLISNGLHRAATTPETFWLFLDEKTNLWYEAVSNRNPKSAMRLSHYYSLSRNDEVQSLKWLAAALALGHGKAADDIEVSATYWGLRHALSNAFVLTSNEVAMLVSQAEDAQDWRSAVRLALYFGFTEESGEYKLRWLRKAQDLGSPVAAYYINLLVRSQAERS